MQLATNNTRKNASSVEATCGNCRWFLCNHPMKDTDEGAPFAWCDPYFRNHSVPCVPWEDASNKTCYSPRK